MAALHAHGVRLSIDDFGTGYSSLARLSSLHIDTLKIDRSFVGNLGDPNNMAIVRAVVSLGRALNVEVLAEGVETPDQLERVRQAGCDLVQGYFTGRPMDARQMEGYLQRENAAGFFIANEDQEPASHESPVKRARSWWRNAAPDAEPQMVINRFIAGMIVLSFNIWTLPKGWLTGWPLTAVVIYLLVGGLIGAHMVLRPNAFTARRIAAMAVDIGALSYETHIGGDTTAWLFAGYVWIIFGNGFRFGPRYQIYAMLAATAGFYGMTMVTPFWRDQPALTVGGIVTVAGIPLYALALIKRLSFARKQAEEANRAKSLFLTSVSHELRTPLNAVIGMGALLESSELNPDQVQMSRTIMTAARSLLSLINGILDMSRIEIGRCRSGALPTLIWRSCSTRSEPFLPHRADSRACSSTCTSPRGRRCFCTATPASCMRFCSILVGNAMKFTQAGSITVAVDAVAQAGRRWYGCASRWRTPGSASRPRRRSGFSRCSPRPTRRS